ncbi:hypothetical protein ASPWEDRAFT_47852 [Aspergillus wentii DTO 134E9]|uniref:Uncharacterized protein n=1 Tax=Aspergillus wentii DTO 134E9 TaxID=1073089 RepID=A0A1L9S256_ASPWE|nr:uncharacterized protein ASPWEDRAFT_47852 [Aspergillus wentii DTO 134E9]OJJ41229.1 hypothetical protein ASPWEDRAFT_47852 [Aspergillus wentii DTO 134E9]
MSTSDDVFQTLSEIFSTRNSQVLEIEILSPGFGPLLQDGRSIGITKKALVQAFAVARSIFFDLIGDSLDTSPHDEKSRSRVDDLLVSSEILLLFDCEHLTACNWRKKRLAALIQDQDSSNGNSPGYENLIQILESELTLMTTYLCSPLHRHTKSPTLWQHRSWVLTQTIRGRSPNQELFTTELTVVLRAGELHPKNYYAFSYIRQLHRALSEIGKETGDTFELLAQSAIHPTVSWCLAHPRDISGWMFVVYLMEAVPDREIHNDIINKVIRFALDVGWEGESLWTFIDLAVKTFGAETAQEAFRTSTDTIPTTPIQPSEFETGKAISEKPWRIWLARARDYWAKSQQPSL